MNLKIPDALYMISEPEAAAAPTEPLASPPASQPASQAMVAQHLWRDLMRRIEKKQSQ